ncbi:GTPase-associated protein 1-related protein [Streptomyces sp. NPDC091212]|uniref:GTPase-associated protein 1-related protein n=1 Tax=Streptomyces sp. NPDC091212 TaxID=3155191 RepID=UPI003412D1D2
MSLAQLHYTSAPPGPDGSGFRFTAVTPGVPESLLREAEQLIGYEPPHEAPPRPTAAELDLFPKAFSHSVLSDGSRLLARTVYTGADYSGRWGNFHAHAVHVPADTPLSPGVPPISAWDSPQWAAGTPEGGSPAPLAELPVARSFDRRGLVSFAAGRAAWLAEFFAGLRELVLRETAPQIVLVERDSADVARWIALASTVLPRASAHRLTFTTYTRRPQLARQQIVGVLPDDAQGLDRHDPRYLVLDCAGGGGPAREPRPAHGTERPAPDAWALTAARVWLGRAPELFAEAAGLPGGRFTAGPLAALALCTGISPGTDGRTEAARWAREPAHTHALDTERLPRFLDGLCAPAEDRTPAETAALAGLFAALDGRAPMAATAPLGALVLTEAVRTPGAGIDLGALRPASLPGDLRRRLAAELADELRDGVAGAAADDGPPTTRAVELLRVAEPLGVDCADLLPGLARRLSQALITDPERAYTPGVAAALEDHFDLRSALLSALDALAAADPPAAVRLLGLVPLSPQGVQTLPHLRMCARMSTPGTPVGAPAGGAVGGTPGGPVGAAPGGAGGFPPLGDDRVTALNEVLRASGVSPFADPLVLRTAVRLVWDGGAPTAGEARLLLAETGSDAHRAAGTWSALVGAALDGPGDTAREPSADRRGDASAAASQALARYRADAPDLAHDLLRCFPRELEARQRGALLLLEFAGKLVAGTADTGWTERALSLRAVAEPVEPAVLDTAFGVLARGLLSEERPDGELYALVHCGDPELIAAYDRAAREERVRERLRTVPAYAADCFTAWSSLPGANRAWDETRTGLLDKVLRPVVRALPAEDTDAVERCLRRTASSRAEEFRTWNRPGALGRLGLRFGGRGRRPVQDGPRVGGVEPPREGGGRP